MLLIICIDLKRKCKYFKLVSIKVDILSLFQQLSFLVFVFYLLPIFKMVGGIGTAGIAASANVLPYISVAIKASF